MRGTNPILAVLGLAVAAVLVAVLVLDSGDSGQKKPEVTEIPGTPSVAFVSPRNGAVQRGTAVVVKADVENFRLAPRHFGGEPMLGEGSIRFSLNRVPDCVEPEKLKKAEESAIGKGRLVGASFDTAQYAGPNGMLGERIGSTGSYSPATRPEIFYSGLRPGFYRLVVTLAANHGATTPLHHGTSLPILQRAGHQNAHCVRGQGSRAH